MKKVRLNLKRGVKKPWSFTLYDSAESAFYLKDEPPYPDGFEEEFRKIVSISPGDILEIEWVGSEWVFSDEEEDLDSDELDHSENDDMENDMPLGRRKKPHSEDYFSDEA